MAGRVERQINDKFYFVLDEVGGSSDCETELGSDVHVAPNNDSSEELNIASEEVTKGQSLGVVSSISPDFDENICSMISVPEKDERQNNRHCLPTSRDESPSKNKCDFYPQESSVVDMDMDMDSDSECPGTNINPLVRVTFRDETVAKRFKSPFLKFISQKLDDGSIVIDSENRLELALYDKDSQKLLDDDLLDFNLDTTPGDNHSDVPNYGKPHDLLLSDKNSDEKPGSGKLHAAAAAATCFNCLGNHLLRDCPQAKDFRAISRNRWKFQTQKEKLPKTSRYHLDENQRFSHLQPGVISKKLRNALNLRRDQQPSFIYRMRHLGYPPAWLEEAKVSHSGVTMYDDTGVPLLEEDEEEGEIVTEGSKDKFDISKIVEFPGFNVPLPSNFKDESKYYQCPDYSEEHSKESLIKLLEPKTVQAYVKKSLTVQKSESRSSLQTDVKKSSSPTIEEMEEKKRLLLLELNDEESGSEAKATSEDSSACQTPTYETPRAPKKVGTVTYSEFGTPVLKSFSPFSKLPSREQFSCNVSDVINFENLPNSTGKYESMKEVISKIRTSTSKSQKE